MAQTRPLARLVLVIVLGGAISCGGKKASVAPPATRPDPPAPTVIDNKPAEPVRNSSPGRRTKTGPLPAPAGPVSTPDKTPHPGSRLPAAVRSPIVRAALAQLGTPYKWGGTSPEEGFDCSGLAYWTFAQQGVSIPRLTSQQFRAGQKVSQDDVLPGDLLFYAWGSDRRQVTHVGIYVGEGQYVHSPGSGRTVLRAAAFDAAHRRRFLGARRITVPPGLAIEADSESLATFFYRVKAGDYIWALARRFEVIPAKLLELNGLKVDDILRIGQRLIIPGVEKGSSPLAPSHRQRNPD